MRGIHIKDKWVLKLADRLFCMAVDVLLFAGIIAMVSILLYFLLSWLTDSGVI